MGQSSVPLRCEYFREREKGHDPSRIFLRSFRETLGNVLAALWFRLALAGVVSASTLWSLLGHSSACEPAPSGRVLCAAWNLSVVRLWEYVLGRRIHLEN